jgi:hypothetical protein
MLEIKEPKHQSDLIQIVESTEHKGVQRNLLSNDSQSGGSDSGEEIDPHDVDRLLEDIEANKVHSNRNHEDRDYFQPPPTTDFQIGTLLWGAKPLPSARSTVMAEDDPHI